eukprot:6205190-Pleurochrysis_carterae.AAC.1
MQVDGLRMCVDIFEANGDDKTVEKSREERLHLSVQDDVAGQDGTDDDTSPAEASAAAAGVQVSADAVGARSSRSAVVVARARVDAEALAARRAEEEGQRHLRERR